MMALLRTAFFGEVGVIVVVFGLLPLAVLVGVCVLYLLWELYQRFFGEGPI